MYRPIIAGVSGQWQNVLSKGDARARRGERAEHFVAELVQQRGWTIIDRNYRIRAGEIDIVALDDGVLVFVEVRARTGSAYGLADETVDARKLTRIMRAALSYIEGHPELADLYWRVDLFALTLDRAGNVVACRQYENLTLD